MTDAHRTISFESLESADLVVDAVYRGGEYGNVRDDPLARLLPCGNQGGCRTSRNQRTGKFNMAILYTSGEEPAPDTRSLGATRETDRL